MVIDLIKTNLTTKVLFEHVISSLPENLTCNLDESVHRRCNHSDCDILTQYVYTYISLVNRINLKIVITLKNIYLCTYSAFLDLIYKFFSVIYFFTTVLGWYLFFCILCILLYISENLGKICIFCNFKKYYIVCYANKMLFFTCMNKFVLNRNFFSTTVIKLNLAKLK